MSLAAEAEKRRYFGSEILISEYIPTGQSGIDRILDVDTAQSWQP